MLTVARNTTALRSELADGFCTGEMWRDILQQRNGTSTSKNFFTPCSRTHWHSHAGGQLLIIESGEGFVATEDEVVRLMAGDLAWTPPHVRHWHGATQERSVLHLAFSFGDVDWQEAVTDELYEAARGVGGS